MRPVYMSSKMKCKNNKKQLSKTTFKFCGHQGSLTSDFDNINKILHNKKLQLARGGGAWKIMPKDSCEVYKERRQRQLERNRQSSEKGSNKNYNNPEKKITKKPSRTARQNYKYGQRRLERKRRPSCSCCSSQTSCTCSTETETF
ncbi:uncharacterized protein LOC126779671 [Nymphalis io]|uniref:uncharacterized protein LOC126779671 n=1 Tax=Inachis io TaxID=171585 RepID=UPI002169B32F|nr:uncharacterized protein LOC126779671 [Nymphalis io]